jgi:hypothetical protein
MGKGSHSGLACAFSLGLSGRPDDAVDRAAKRTRDERAASVTVAVIVLSAGTGSGDAARPRCGAIRSSARSPYPMDLESVQPAPVLPRWCFLRWPFEE